MPPHKFAVGQNVAFRSGSFEDHIPRGVYSVVKALPGDDLDRTYRVKHGQDGHERILREKQLEPHSWSPSSPAPAAPSPPRRSERQRVLGSLGNRGSRSGG